MTISPTSLNSDFSQLSSPEINLVATSKLTPEHFVKSNQLDFISSSDDLGSLVYSFFSLPSGNSISLIHYIDASYPGVEVYINPNSPSPSSILSETLRFLNLSPNDLDWIHPQIDLLSPNQTS